MLIRLGLVCGSVLAPLSTIASQSSKLTTRAFIYTLKGVWEENTTNQTQLPACTGFFLHSRVSKGPVFYIGAKIQTKLLPAFAWIVRLASTSDKETFTEENCLYLDQTSRSRSKHENDLIIYSSLHYLSSCWGSRENNIIKWKVWWTDINLKLKKKKCIWQIP